MININYLKTLLLRYKSVLKDTLALSILQIANQIIPLLLIPLLVSILGIEKYGVIAIALSVAAGLKIIIDFGFDLTGTDLISKNKNNKLFVSKVYSSIILLKLSVLIVLSIILIFSVTYLTSDLYASILKILLLWLLGEVFFPRHLFQGYGMIKLITVFSILSKIIMLFIVFLFLKSSDDLLLYPIAIGIGSLTANISATIYLYTFKGISPFNVSFNIIKKLFIISYKLVLSRLLVFSYSNSIIFIINFIFGESYSGIYSVCQKIIGGVSAFLNPISEAFFPRLSSSFSLNKQDYFLKFRKLLKYSIILSSILVLFLNLFKKPILKLFLQDVNVETLNFFTLMSLTIISSQIGNYFTQFFVIIKKTNWFLISVLLTLVITVSSSLILSKYYGFLGIGISVILGQTAHLIINYYFRKNYFKCVDL